MMTLKSIYLLVLQEAGATPQRAKTYSNEPGIFAGGVYQKSAPHTDSGWKYRGGFAGWSHGAGETDLPSDDEGQQDNEYEAIEGND